MQFGDGSLRNDEEVVRVAVSQCAISLENATTATALRQYIDALMPFLNASLFPSLPCKDRRCKRMESFSARLDLLNARLQTLECLRAKVEHLEAVRAAAEREAILFRSPCSACFLHWGVV